jgi:N-acyl-D-amino-acid deacylase
MPKASRSVAAVLLGAALGAGGARAAETSAVIRGALIADGSGKPLRRADVRIRGDRIVAVGEVRPEKGEAVWAGDGLVVAPGFIDVHNHSTEGLSEDPVALTQVSQGITTLIVGADGGSPWPLAAYLEKRREYPAAVNVGVLAGHATIRRQVMGSDYRRVSTPDETAKMAALVEQAMREGAFGLSSGLEYEVGSYSATEELVAMSRAAAARGGFYMTHIRDEADKSIEAFEEAIAIGERGGIPVQISHIKLGTVGVWGKLPDVLSRVEAARRRGLDVMADAYPYTAWHSNIEVLVPNKRCDDPESVAEALADVGGPANVTITRCRAHPEYEKRTMEEIARTEGITPVDLFIRIVRDGGANIIGHSMREEDVAGFLRQPWVMVASDGGIDSSHPRGAGTFPRVLARYVREEALLSLPEAIRKMTALPAARLRLGDRGRIAPGMKADLVLLDPGSVSDRSTFSDPQALASGVRLVFVNGQVVWGDGRVTGARPGRVLTPAGELPTEPTSLAGRVDAVFRRFDRRDTPGCALAVMRDGAVVYQRGYGMASLEHRIRIAPETVFDIGSVAKQFAAASILLLARQERLSLDDDVRRWVWELPDYGRKVTIRHLLHHVSGVPDYIGLLSLAGRRGEDLSTEEEALAALSRRNGLDFEPGSRYRYSNSGYFLLSIIVRRASGQDLRAFARENVFEPLGMSSTEYLDDHARPVPRKATSYAPAAGGFRVDQSDWEQVGDGGVQTTVLDFARWARDFDGGAVGGPGFYDELTRPGRFADGRPMSYALGLRVDEYRGSPRISHGGSWAGFRAAFMRFPSHRFAAMAFCNVSNAGPAGLLRQVADIYLEKELTGAPRPETPKEPARRLPAAELARRTGLYWDAKTGILATVSEKEGTLRYEDTDGNDSALLASAEPGRFLVEGTPSPVRVDFRTEGPLREMRLTYPDETPILFHAVLPASPAPPQLAAYRGRYVSEELGAVYEVVWEGARLTLRRPGHSPSELTARFEDAFADPDIGVIRFSRGESGEVCGLTVRYGAQSLEFAKLPGTLP